MLAMNGNSELCFAGSDNGWQWMVRNFDGLPREVRDLLNASRFNICAACFAEQRRARGAWDAFNPSVDIPLLGDFELAIELGLGQLPDHGHY
jgi:hypothetical protein